MSCSSLELRYESIFWNLFLFLSQPYNYIILNSYDIISCITLYMQVPESKGYQIKFETPVIFKKKYSEEQLDAIVARLAAYNPEVYVSFIIIIISF